MPKTKSLYAILFAFILVIYHLFYLTYTSHIDGFSLLSEGLITLLILAILVKLNELHSNKAICILLNIGFSLMFIARLSDSLDEIYLQPELFTTIFEDVFEVIGFLLVLIGMINWVKFNNDLNSQLQTLATTDELTKLFTRRHFNQVVSDEIKRSQRSKKQFGLLMLDIDNFKAVNDQYGHATGDSALQAVAQALQESTRQIDTVARWGGEEFIVLLVDIDDKNCLNIAEKIRKAIERLAIQDGGNEIRFTISIGAATSQASDTDTDTIINRADKLLYQAKQNGKNRVEQDTVA